MMIGGDQDSCSAGGLGATRFSLSCTTVAVQLQFCETRCNTQGGTQAFNCAECLIPGADDARRKAPGRTDRDGRVMNCGHPDSRMLTTRNSLFIHPL